MHFVGDRLVGAAEAARILGVSRQRVAQLAAEAADFPPSETDPGGGRMWNRHAIEVWAVGHPERGPRYQPPTSSGGWQAHRRLGTIVKLATDEARHLHHRWVGADHLLLAVLHPECPGAARNVLASVGLSLDGVRAAYVNSLGDPFEAKDEWTTMPPGTQLLLERARLKAFELADEEVTSQHLLLALLDDWDGRLPAYVARDDLDADSIRARVLAITESVADPEPPARPPLRVHAERRIPRPPEPELALTPEGRDPRRRMPWGSAVFHDAEGRAITQGIALRQYLIDRDGNPVLTTDGHPVHVMIDEEGRFVLDEEGKPILTAVEIPQGSALKPVQQY